MFSILMMLLGLYLIQVVVCCCLIIDDDSPFESKKEFLDALSPLYLIRLFIKKFKSLR